MSQIILKIVPSYELGRLRDGTGERGSAHGQERCERLLNTAGTEDEPEQ